MFYLGVFIGTFVGFLTRSILQTVADRIDYTEGDDDDR